MGSHIFGFFGVRQFFIFTVSMQAYQKCLYCRWKLKNGSIHKNRTWLSWGRENYNNIFAQSDKDGVFNWPQNRLYWGRGAERPAAHTQQKLTQVTLPPRKICLKNNDVREVVGHDLISFIICSLNPCPVHYINFTTLYYPICMTWIILK